MKSRKNRGRSHINKNKNNKKNKKNTQNNKTGRVRRPRRVNCSKKPNETHALQVSQLHKIYYYEFGAADGEPVFVLHGGPGDRSRFDHVRLFDCAKYRIIFIDQRGCGRSRPACELKENTTNDLVEDIERVRIAAGLGGDDTRIQIFGASWGTFLALSYAIKYPAVVSRLVLRSVFLCTRQEYADVEKGEFVRKMFPDVYAEYVRGATDPGNATREYYDKILSTGSAVARENAGTKVRDYENATMTLVPPPFNAGSSSSSSSRARPTQSDLCAAKMAAHYFGGRCFSRDIIARLSGIKHIPVTIVQGRYDAVTPAYYAHQLHMELPRSTIHYTVAGHAMSDAENWSRLARIFGGTDDVVG